MPLAARSANSILIRSSSALWRKSAPPDATSSGGRTGTPAAKTAVVSTAVPAKNSQKRQWSKETGEDGVGRTLVTSSALPSGSASASVSPLGDFSAADGEDSHQGVVDGSTERAKPGSNNSCSAAAEWARAGGALGSEVVPQPSSARADPHFLEEPFPSFLEEVALLFPFPPAFFDPLSVSGQIV